MRPLLLLAAVFALGTAHAADATKKDRKPKQAPEQPLVAHENQPKQSVPDDAHITGMPSTFVIPKNTCESGRAIQELRRNPNRLDSFRQQESGTAVQALRRSLVKPP